MRRGWCGSQSTAERWAAAFESADCAGKEGRETEAVSELFGSRDVLRARGTVYLARMRDPRHRFRARVTGRSGNPASHPYADRRARCPAAHGCAASYPRATDAPGPRPPSASFVAVVHGTLNPYYGRADVGFMATSVPTKRLRIRRPGDCVVCRHPLAVGEEAIWNRDSRTLTCLACTEPPSSAPSPSSSALPPAVSEGQPGASALREYERRHAKREDHARQQLGGFGVFLSHVIDEPQSTKAWRQGGKAEVRTGNRLTKLLEIRASCCCTIAEYRDTATRTSTTSPSAPPGSW